jgi:hypothetical protein
MQERCTNGVIKWTDCVVTNVPKCIIISLMDQIELWAQEAQMNIQEKGAKL